MDSSFKYLSSLFAVAAQQQGALISLFGCKLCMSVCVIEGEEEEDWGEESLLMVIVI